VSALLKSSSNEIQDGGQRLNWKWLNNFTEDCPIVLKFAMWVDLVIKAEKTGGMGDLKWQCCANWHLYQIIII